MTDITEVPFKEADKLKRAAKKNQVLTVIILAVAAYLAFKNWTVIQSYWATFVADVKAGWSELITYFNSGSTSAAKNLSAGKKKSAQISAANATYTNSGSDQFPIKAPQEATGPAISKGAETVRPVETVIAKPAPNDFQGHERKSQYGGKV